MSQNRGRDGVGRDLKEDLIPAPLPQAGTPSPRPLLRAPSSLSLDTQGFVFVIYLYQTAKKEVNQCAPKAVGSNLPWLPALLEVTAVTLQMTDSL